MICCKTFATPDILCHQMTIKQKLYSLVRSQSSLKQLSIFIKYSVFIRFHWSRHYNFLQIENTFYFKNKNATYLLRNPVNYLIWIMYIIHNKKSNYMKICQE